MIEAWLCSALVFRLSLHSCSTLSRLLRISANQHILSLPIGAISVGLAGSAAACTYQLLSHKHVPLQFSLKDVVAQSLASMIVFRVAGGSFKWICCADLFKPGPFAIDSVPALLNQVVSTNQRRTIQSIGRKYGCHSCGMFMLRSRRYIADHIPPSHLMRNSFRSTWTSAQRLYPHCTKCASVQGPAVSSSKRTIVTPALWGNWRLSYVWLPTPEILEQIYARIV